MWEVTDGLFLLRTPGVARYLVSDGAQIIIEPEAGAPERVIRTHLMSSAMAALLHQRGLLTLHGSAIAHGTEGIVFCGPSGAGKSTIAAYLCIKHGHALLADDLCVVAGKQSSFQLLPCAPYIRVWLDTVEALDLDSSSFQKDIVRRKYHVPMGHQFGDQPLPLKRVYVLTEGGTDERISITRLTGMRAARILIDNTFRARQLTGMGLRSAHLSTCAAVAEQVQVFALRRPFGLELMDQTVARLEEHFDDEVESSRAGRRPSARGLTTLTATPQDK